MGYSGRDSDSYPSESKESLNDEHNLKPPGADTETAHGIFVHNWIHLDIQHQDIYPLILSPALPCKPTLQVLGLFWHPFLCYLHGSLLGCFSRFFGRMLQPTECRHCPLC